MKTRWIVLALVAAMAIGSASVIAEESVDLFDGIVWSLPFTYGLGASSYSGDDLPEWILGVWGGWDVAVRLDGKGDYLYISSYPDLHPPILTVSFWVRLPEAVDEAVFIWAKENEDGNGWIVRVDENGFGMLVDGANGFYVDTDPAEFFPVDEWVHVSVMFDSTTGEQRIYRNGVRQENLRVVGQPRSITPNDADILIGSGPNGEGVVPVDLDEISIYTRFLNEAEVRELAAKPE